jgi:hypothetical protein
MISDLATPIEGIDSGELPRNWYEATSQANRGLADPMRHAPAVSPTTMMVSILLESDRDR